MPPPDPYSLLDPNPVLKEAGWWQAEFVMSCAADLRAHPWAAYAAGPLRWLALGGAALICMGLLAHDGNHGVPVAAAVLLAALASSIAGFAFSAICGAMLFHLTDDPVQAVQIMIVCSIANQCGFQRSRPGIPSVFRAPFQSDGAHHSNLMPPGVGVVS
jgi:hypothetical protein